MGMAAGRSMRHWLAAVAPSESLQNLQLSVLDPALLLLDRIQGMIYGCAVLDVGDGLCLLCNHAQVAALP